MYRPAIDIEILGYESVLLKMPPGPDSFFHSISFTLLDQYKYGSYREYIVDNLKTSLKIDRIDNEAIEYISNELNKNFIIIEDEELFFVNNPSSNGTIVLLVEEKSYNLCGVREDNQNIITLFSDSHPFIEHISQ